MTTRSSRPLKILTGVIYLTGRASRSPGKHSAFLVVTRVTGLGKGDDGCHLGDDLPVIVKNKIVTFRCIATASSVFISAAILFDVSLTPCISRLQPQTSDATIASQPASTKPIAIIIFRHENTIVPHTALTSTIASRSLTVACSTIVHRTPRLQ
ncbi:hypothetical protein RYX36_015910 [Vicia faba]